MARLADVAIVEADHAKAARGELLAERVVPMDHLRAEAHDQQQGFGVTVAEDLVADVDAVGADGLGRLMSGHGAFPCCWSMLYRMVCPGNEARHRTRRL